VIASPCRDDQLQCASLRLFSEHASPRRERFPVGGAGCERYWNAGRHPEGRLAVGRDRFSTAGCDCSLIGPMPPSGLESADIHADLL
jgi:hypothetical protein